MVRIDGVDDNVCIYINCLICHYALAMIIPTVIAPAVTIPHSAQSGPFPFDDFCIWVQEQNSTSTMVSADSTEVIRHDLLSVLCPQS
jgi:hypothetical protein